ncbi:Glycosyltransferase involved in cell wall bisynthesis [Desulfomicrobium norvegicum]|uniref:Glycosyltransferase involved in cell wall bisynthesis n=1 Tax=Desulfomicrobium norvegicum (strain DSM 1741 / NCIMB 8310) TaxID=52561 RepID=A0A8G2F3M6_DESNO|nr:glycosyltransferase family 4 protein [Desulfomicrobium norvegicum]SFL46733.1 Glycosyltransferase involved in cell wall bisynthesis [Desulfomicrobium norvegicum]
MKKPKLLYFVSEDWYFCSHRLPLAIAAKDAGYDVAVVTRVTAHGERIRDAGLRLVPFEMSRRAMNLFLEAWVLWRLVRVYRREKPDIVHHVAMKPVLYGTLAARLCGVRHVVNALAGMGWILASGTWLARIVKWSVLSLFRVILPRTSVIVQNRDDAELIRGLGCHRVHLIRGAGVDVAAIQASSEPPGPCVVLLAARMLWDKGVGEYVEAARLLRARGVDVRMVLAGDPDESNPASIPREVLYGWHENNTVEWLGYREDMPALLKSCHIVCLPSYREGIPKFVLEGLAAGLPVVTTDTPGCRETVAEGVNGFLVPPRDALALADALDRLISDDKLRKSMGLASRNLAISEFSSERIIAETLAVYASLAKASIT